MMDTLSTLHAQYHRGEQQSDGCIPGPLDSAGAASNPHRALDSPGTFLGLPSTWLAQLVQHIASGPGGLTRAATLSQTCSLLHNLSESPAVTYRDIHVDRTITSPDDPVWQWLVKNKGRFTGLTVKVILDAPYGPESDDDDDYAVVFGRDWSQPQQILSTIPDLNLTVEWCTWLCTLDHPFVKVWLRADSPPIDLLISQVTIVGRDGLSMRDFCMAAARCRTVRMDTFLRAPRNEPLDMKDLAPAAGSLVHLAVDGDLGKLVGFQSLASLSQLTALEMVQADLAAEEPWAHLAKLQSLEKLHLEVAAFGDPSPLSELSALSALSLISIPAAFNQAAAYPFSSLQALSTLQQLEDLKLEKTSTTSLVGLAGLNRLRELWIADAPGLVSLDGVAAGVRNLKIDRAPFLVGLAGIGSLTGLQRLDLVTCGVSSLQGLAGLSSLNTLLVTNCPLTSLKGFEGSISRCLRVLELRACTELRTLVGVQNLNALRELRVSRCWVTSFRPVAELAGGLDALGIWYCHEVRWPVLELPHIQPTAHITSCRKQHQGSGASRRGEGVWAKVNLLALQHRMVLEIFSRARSNGCPLRLGLPVLIQACMVASADRMVCCLLPVFLHVRM